MKTIAIVYGWAEGLWQSKRLRKALQRRGFRIARNGAGADVIVAHSFGCYLIPQESKARLLVFINPAYWPKRTLATSALKKQREDFLNTHRHSGLAWWATKLLHNVWYILSRPTLSYFVATRHNLAYIPKPTSERKVLIIRNELDTFCPPNIQQLIDPAGNSKFVELPGGHDDCWMNPDPYVDLILREME